MTCKDCVHYEVCESEVEAHHDNPRDLEVNGIEEFCRFFKPKSRFVGLPCEVGQTVYLLMGGFVEEMKLNHLFMSFKPNEQHPIDFVKEFEDFGKTVFLSREEAEKALSERSST